MTSPTQFPSSSLFSVAIPDEPPAYVDSAGWTAALLLFRRRFRMIFLLSVLLSLVAVPLILMLPRLYYAETRLMVSPTPVFKFAEDAAGRAPNLDINAEIERLGSQGVVISVVDQFAVAALPEFNPDLKQGSAFQDLTSVLMASVQRILADAGIAPPLAVRSETEQHDRVLANFRKSLNVSRDGTTNVVTVGFSSRDPVLAAEVPGAIVAAYLAQSQAQWKSEIARTTEWLDTRIAIERVQLSESQAAFDRFRHRSGVQSGDTEMAASDRLAKIEARLDALRRDRLGIAATRRSVAAASANPDLPSLSETPRLLDLRKEHQSEVRELEKSAAVYGENTSAITFRKDRIAAIMTEISAELTSYDHVLSLRDAALSTEEKQLRIDAEKTRNAVATIRGATPQVTNFAETLRAHEEALSLLEYRKLSLDAQSALAPVSFDILATADLPIYPEGPGRKLYIAAALLGGALLALFAAGIAELRDTTLRSHEQLSHLKRMVPIGLWPVFSAAERRKTSSAIATNTDASGASVLRDMLLMLECANQGRMPQVLTVTTPLNSHNDVPVAEWIALQLAKQGQSIQLIETREGKSRGFFERFAKKNAQDDQDPRLKRRLLSRIVELHGGDVDVALNALVTQARTDGIITIIDAPPLLSKGGMRYARIGDGLLLVSGWGKTSRATVELAYGLLSKLGVTQIFSLITDADPKRHRLYGFTDRLSLSPSV